MDEKLNFSVISWLYSFIEPYIDKESKLGKYFKPILQATFILTACAYLYFTREGASQEKNISNEKILERAKVYDKRIKRPDDD